MKCTRGPELTRQSRQKSQGTHSPGSHDHPHKVQSRTSETSGGTREATHARTGSGSETWENVPRAFRERQWRDSTWDPQTRLRTRREDRMRRFSDPFVVLETVEGGCLRLTRTARARSRHCGRPTRRRAQDSRSRVARSCRTAARRSQLLSSACFCFQSGPRFCILRRSTLHSPMSYIPAEARRGGMKL